MTDDRTDEGSTNDVEKRWRDPQALRAAVKYVLVVVALTAAAFAATAAWRSMITAVMVPGILLAGGIIGLVRTYRVWKAGGVWPIWQAASWFLLFGFLMFLGVPFSIAHTS